MAEKEAKIVARIKTCYARRLADKLVMQKDMATLRDKYGWTQMDIVEATGISQSTVQRWLAAYDGNTHMGIPIVLTPPDDRVRSDLAVAKRVFAQATPEQVRDILDQPGVLHKVGAAASHLAPKQVDMRTEAEKKADKATEAEWEGIGRPRERVPLWIEKATGDVKWFIEHDRQMSEGEYAQAVMALMQLGHELWVYGAQRGHDVSQLTHELERWQEMLDGEED